MREFDAGITQEMKAVRRTGQIPDILQPFNPEQTQPMRAVQRTGEIPDTLPGKTDGEATLGSQTGAAEPEQVFLAEVHSASEFETISIQPIISSAQAQETHMHNTIMNIHEQRDEELSVVDRVIQALRIADERHLLPIPIKTLLKLLLSIEHLKHRKKKEPILKRIRKRSARAWWHWHMISEGQQKSEEKRKHSIVGKSGCWFADAKLEQPKRLTTTDDVIETLSQNILGLIKAHTYATSQTQGLYNTLALEVARETKAKANQQRGEAIAPFKDRLDVRNKTVRAVDWLEFAARHGVPDWDAYFSEEKRDIARRTDDESRTIAIRIDTLATGKRTIWYKIPERKRFLSEIDRDIHRYMHQHEGVSYDTAKQIIELEDRKKQQREIELSIRQALQVPNAEVGTPVEHPVLELVISKQGAELANELELSKLAQAGTVAKVVLHQSPNRKVTNVRWAFTHLTSNESDGWDIIQNMLSQNDMKLQVDHEELYKPSIVNIIRGKKQKLKNKLKRKVTSDIEEIDAVAGLQFSESENDLFYQIQRQLKSRTPPLTVTTAELVALSQNLISPEGTYICVGSNYSDLQMTEVPSGETQQMRQMFYTFGQIMTRIAQTAPITTEHVDQWKLADPDNAHVLDTLLEVFRASFEETTRFVNKDIEECQHGRGMLSVLETYISSFSRSALRRFVPSASAVLESCTAQVSLVSHVEEQLVRFVSAHSSSVHTALGGFSYMDAHKHMTRTFTTRWRASIEDIKRLCAQTEIRQQYADQDIQAAVLRETQRRAFEVRKNLVILCLLISFAFPDEKNQPKIQSLFHESWNVIGREQIPFLY